MKKTGMLFPTISDCMRYITREITSEGVVARTKVSFIRVEPRREPVHVSGCIGTATTADDSGEANEDGRFFILPSEEGGSREVGPVTVGCEYTVGAGTAGMDHSFGDLDRVPLINCYHDHSYEQ